MIKAAVLSLLIWLLKKKNTRREERKGRGTQPDPDTHGCWSQVSSNEGNHPREPFLVSLRPLQLCEQLAAWCVPGLVWLAAHVTVKLLWTR